MKSYTLRPDTFTLNVNVLVQAQRTKRIALIEEGATIRIQCAFRAKRSRRVMLRIKAERVRRTEHLYNIQCSEIFTLGYEKLHTET